MCPHMRLKKINHQILGQLKKKNYECKGKEDFPWRQNIRNKEKFGGEMKKEINEIEH